MSETTTQRDTAHIRQVTSVETLKALADPLRLSILTALMMDVRDPQDLPVMSVKELAARLGEPQTKLYRHVKQLEAAGLIRVASTRVVSGILEQRYQACQVGLAFGREILRDPAHADEGASVVTAMMNRYLDRFLARQISGGTGISDGGDDGDVMKLASTSVSPTTARLIRGKLQEIIDALKQPVPDGETTVTVEVLLGFFSPEQDGR